MAHRISPPRLSGYVAMAARSRAERVAHRRPRRRQRGELGADRPLGSSSSNPCNDHRQAEALERRRFEGADPFAWPARLLGRARSGNGSTTSSEDARGDRHRALPAVGRREAGPDGRHDPVPRRLRSNAAARGEAGRRSRTVLPDGELALLPRRPAVDVRRVSGTSTTSSRSTRRPAAGAADRARRAAPADRLTAYRPSGLCASWQPRVAAARSSFGSLRLIRRYICAGLSGLLLRQR